jgi:streptogramin lyase
VIGKAMAKQPEDRYPTCAALVAAAEEGLGLRKPPVLRRRRLLLPLAATAAILIALAAALSVEFATRGEGNTASLFAPVQGRIDALVRIDPATNAVNTVIDAGWRPFATAIGGNSVWVYNHRLGITEIDAATNTVRQTTPLSAAPVDLGPLTGPVLAADAAGAWLVGADDKQRPLLTRVLSGSRGKRLFRLDREPRAVALGYGAVWVLGRGARDYQVLRVDPAAGEVTARTHFAASARLSSLAVGLGAVWVVSSSSAVLYRIDPHSAAVTGHTDLGQRAGRPLVAFGTVWVVVSDGRGNILHVDPRTLRVTRWACCPFGKGYDLVSGFGSTWAYFDSTSGTVLRWYAMASFRLAARIQVTEPEAAASDGLCLTSIAAGAGAVWVTVTPTVAYTCEA